MTNKNLEAKAFEVMVNARKCGAIGMVQRFQFKVMATDVTDAREKGRAEAYRAGLEHVFVTGVFAT